MNYSKNSTIAISTSTNYFKDKSKGKRLYTYGFKPEIVSFDNVADIMNAKAVSAAHFKKGHRKNDNILELYPVLLDDFDHPDSYKYFEKCLNDAGIAYIRVPSRSYADHPYKFHYMIPTDKPLPMDTLEAYRSAKLASYQAIGLDIELYNQNTDTSVAYERARYLGPACENKATAEIMATVSKTVYGKALSIVIPDEVIQVSTKTKSQKKLTCKAEPASTLFTNASKWDASKYRKSVVVYQADDVYYLNPDAIIKTEHGLIKLSKLNEAIKEGDTSARIKTICPICNQEHSDGMGDGYGWVQRSTTGGDVMLHCSGEHCEGKTFLIDSTSREITTAFKLSFTNIDFFRLRHYPPSTMQLLLFYLSEAQKQGTNLIFASQKHTKEALKMGNDQHRNARSTLKSLGYIEPIQKPHNGKVWHYTRLIYVSGTGIRPEYCPDCGSEINHKPWQFCPECGVQNAS